METALRRLLGLSPTRIKRCKFRPDGILLDGTRVNTRQSVHAGQMIMVNLPEQEETTLLPTPGTVDILYEDGYFLCVNKPAGLSVHPGPGHYADTLGNRLTWLFQQRGETLVFRPVNRLDIGTSGAMLVAKSAQAHERLQQKLHTPEFERTYLALVSNCPEPEQGTIDAPIGPVAGELNQYYVTSAGKPARTDYRVLARYEGAALVELKLHTGRTHQIRVHMAHMGCPLLGDKVYGGVEGFGRPALHSRSIRLKHPFTGTWLELTAPLPQDFASVVGEMTL